MNEVVVCPVCGQKNRLPVAAPGVPRCGRCHHALPWIVEADERSFPEATKSSSLVLVDLWAPWCGPCRLIEGALEEAARTFAGRLKIVKVNVDNSASIAASYQAASIPTLLLLRDGQLVDRIVGAVPTHRLVEQVSAALGPELSPRVRGNAPG